MDRNEPVVWPAVRTLLVDRSVVRIPSTSIEQEEGKFKDEIVPVETIQVIEKDGEAWLVGMWCGCGCGFKRWCAGRPRRVTGRPTDSRVPCRCVHVSGAFGRRCRLLLRPAGEKETKHVVIERDDGIRADFTMKASLSVAERVKFRVQRGAHVQPHHPAGKSCKRKGSLNRWGAEGLATGSRGAVQRLLSTACSSRAWQSHQGPRTARSALLQALLCSLDWMPRPVPWLLPSLLSICRSCKRCTLCSAREAPPPWATHARCRAINSMLPLICPWEGARQRLLGCEACLICAFAA